MILTLVTSLIGSLLVCGECSDKDSTHDHLLAKCSCERIEALKAKLEQERIDNESCDCEETEGDLLAGCNCKKRNNGGQA